MICNKCKCVFKAKYTHCPYCGEKYISNKNFLSKEINFLNWFNISIKNLLFLLITNIFLISVVVDLLCYGIWGNNLHLCPWFFLGYIPLFVLEIFVWGLKYTKYVMTKYLLTFTIFAILVGISYGGMFFGIPYWHFIFGYYIPAIVTFSFLFAIIRYIIIREYNIFGVFIWSFLLDCLISLCFILSRFDFQGINSNIVSRLFVSLSFAFAIIVSFNAAVYMVLKFKTSARKEL